MIHFTNPLTDNDNELQLFRWIPQQSTLIFTLPTRLFRNIHLLFRYRIKAAAFQHDCSTLIRQ